MTIKNRQLPIDITDQCYIDTYENVRCLYYKNVPLILVNYPFWTEDIVVRAGYIDYNKTEKGYSLLIDVPQYDNKGKLIKVDNIYYGLFSTKKEFEDWLNNPTFFY